MNKNEVFKIILEILKNERMITTEALQSATEKTNIVTDIGVNSTDIVNLIAKVENRFEVDFEDDEVDNLDRSIASIVELTLKKLSNSNKK